MKRVLRSVLAGSVAIFAAARLSPGISYSQNIEVLILAAMALAVINATVLPFIKIVTLPFNLLTLGLLSFFLNAAMLYLATLIIPGFTVSSFSLAGLEISLFWSYVLSAAVIGFINSTLNWLLK